MPKTSYPSDARHPANDRDPGIDSVFRFLTYSLSIPERALRGTTAVVGGLVQESARLLVPSAFQNSRTYRVFVSQMIDFLARDVGGVRRAASTSSDAAEPSNAPTSQVENFVARKAVGNFIELAGLATIHLSPLTLLAVVSDVAYGSKAYLNELATELRKQGIIDERSTIVGVQSLLDAVGRASGTTAQSLDLPPLTLDEIRKSIRQTVEAVSQIDVTKVLPQSEIDRLWQDMKAVGEQQQVGLFQLGSAMAMYSMNQLTNVGKGTIASVQVAGLLLDRTIFGHYRESLGRISRQGFFPFLSDSSRPYIEAVWNNFSLAKPTLTEDILHGRWTARMWYRLRGWFAHKKPISGDSSRDSAGGADPGDSPRPG